MEKQVPLKLEGVSENIYAGFWIRLAALLLDALIIAPVGLLIAYVNSHGKDAYFFTVIPGFLMMLVINVAFVKLHGGSPGKLIMGIRVINLNGDDAGWREAWLRHIVSILIALLQIAVMVIAIRQADAQIYKSLSWTEQTRYLIAFTPLLFGINSALSTLWRLADLIVFFMNPRRRAIHDYIAGTVVVKARYLQNIRTYMAEEYF